MAEKKEIPISTLPLLPLKNSVLFPGLLMPLAVGRPGSMAAVEKALATEDKEMVVVTQRDASIDAPTANDLYTLGTRAVIRKAGKSKDQIEILVLGMERVVLVKVEENGSMTARVRMLPLPDDSSRETEALTLGIIEMGSKFVGLIQAPNATPQELARMFTTQEDPLRLAYMLASIMNLDSTREQSLLEAPTRTEALRMMHGWLAHEVGVLEV